MASNKRSLPVMRPMGMPAPAPKARGRRLSGIGKLLLALVGVWLVAGIGMATLALRERRASSGPSMIFPHTQAPSFVLSDQAGRQHHLRDYEQRSVALVFVPDAGAETQAELASVLKEVPRFDTLGVKLFAVAPIAKEAAEALHTRLKLPFPVLCDDGGRVAQSYGVAPHRPRLSYLLGANREVLLPLATVQPAEHGPQLLELSECCLDKTPTAPSKLLGKPIADFTLTDTATGKLTRLYGDKKQKATVVLFLSSRCPCSGKYDVRNKALAERYSKLGVRFVAVNGSQDEPSTEVAAHAKKAAFPFPVVKDTDGKVVDALGAQVTPEAFVLDAKGTLRYHGRVDDSRDGLAIRNHDLRNALDLVLAGSTATLPETRAFGCAIARHATEGGR